MEVAVLPFSKVDIGTALCGKTGYGVRMKTLDLARQYLPDILAVLDAEDIRARRVRNNGCTSIADSRNAADSSRRLRRSQTKDVGSASSGRCSRGSGRLRRS
jgi:hypothetical protein